MMSVTYSREATLDKMLRAVEKVIVPEVDSIEGYYSYIPLPLGEFFDGLDAAVAYIIEKERCFSGKRFLDVGCGIGLHMLMAELRGFSVAGLDVQSEYVKVAHALVPTAHLTVCDAFDYEDYELFDVVYMYHPASDPIIQQRLEDYVIARMRPGALLFLAGRRREDLVSAGDTVWVV